MPNAANAEISHRVEDVLRIRLDVAQFHDIVQYASPQDLTLRGRCRGIVCRHACCHLARTLLTDHRRCGLRCVFELVAADRPFSIAPLGVTASGCRLLCCRRVRWVDPGHREPQFLGSPPQLLLQPLPHLLGVTPPQSASRTPSRTA